jgi:hypothetical protein
VERVRTLVRVEAVDHAVELERGARDAVGVAADRRAEVRVLRAVEVVVERRQRDHDVRPVPVAVGHLDRHEAGAERDEPDLDAVGRDRDRTVEAHGRTTGVIVHSQR